MPFVFETTILTMVRQTPPTAPEENIVEAETVPQATQINASSNETGTSHQQNLSQAARAVADAINKLLHTVSTAIGQNELSEDEDNAEEDLSTNEKLHQLSNKKICFHP